MIIRKNTKAFKTIVEIITTCLHRADRDKLVRLYITRAGHTIQDRISVEGIQDGSALFYEMNYQHVLNKLHSPAHQLQVSDDTPGIYFFHSTSNKEWDETPFEFDVAIHREFSSLPDLPIVRKKEKIQKTVITSQKPARSSSLTSDKKSKKVRDNTEHFSRQPNYKLRHKIAFTALESIVFRQPQRTKQDVLEYYHKVAGYILPFLKDRPVSVRSSENGSSPAELSVEGYFSHHKAPLPSWLHTKTIKAGKEEKTLLLCNDKEHLMYYVECGCIEFSSGSARINTMTSPDYLLLAVDFPGNDPDRSVRVLEDIHIVLDGLQLPSALKTDGRSGIHLYIPLDSKSSFASAREVAEYIGRLIRLKIPDDVLLKDIDEYVYGRVLVDCSINASDQVVVAPWSLVIQEGPAFAVPMEWRDFPLSDITEEWVYKRVKRDSDPFATLRRKGVNTDDLLKRLRRSYDFLLL